MSMITESPIRGTTASGVRKGSVALVLTLALGGSFTMAQTANQPYTPIANSAIRWSPAPSAIPRGAQIAILMGDPTKAGPFVVRLKFPAGYVFPPHTHSVDELVTVMSGTVYAGKGMTLDRSKGRPLAAHGYNPQRADEPHYLWTPGETIIQIHGVGPFDFKYVKAADDPRT